MRQSKRHSAASKLEEDKGKERLYLLAAMEWRRHETVFIYICSIILKTFVTEMSVRPRFILLIGEAVIAPMKPTSAQPKLLTYCFMMNRL